MNLTKKNLEEDSAQKIFAATQHCVKKGLHYENYFHSNAAPGVLPESLQWLRFGLSSVKNMKNGRSTDWDKHAPCCQDIET
jgi:hypothetical protein